MILECEFCDCLVCECDDGWAVTASRPPISPSHTPVSPAVGAQEPASDAHTDVISLPLSETPA